MSQYNSGKYCSHIRSKKIGTHTCNITYVITNIICDGCWVARIIFGDACLNLSNKISTYVCSLCVDTTSNAGKKCNAFSAKRKTCQHFYGFCYLMIGSHGFRSKYFQKNDEQAAKT